MNREQGKFEKSLSSLVYKWSDENITRAEKFVDLHRKVIPKRIGVSQLYAMRNSVLVGFEHLMDFLKSRQIRARKGGFFHEEGCYDDLINQIHFIREDAKQLLKKMHFKEDEHLSQKIEKELISRFIQHIISQSVSTEKK